jgi:hypothetical protein
VVDRMESVTTYGGEMEDKSVSDIGEFVLIWSGRWDGLFGAGVVIDGRIYIIWVRGERFRDSEVGLSSVEKLLSMMEYACYFILLPVQ